MRIEKGESFKVEEPYGWFNVVSEDITIGTDSFPNINNAQHFYLSEQETFKNEIKREELKQYLIIAGGFLGGIGLRVLSNSDNLSLTSQNTYLGIGLLSASGIMAKIGYEAFDKYDMALELFQKGKRRLAYLANLGNPYVKSTDAELVTDKFQSKTNEEVELFGNSWNPRRPNFNRVDLSQSLDSDKEIALEQKNINVDNNDLSEKVKVTPSRKRRTKRQLSEVPIENNIEEDKGNIIQEELSVKVSESLITDSSIKPDKSKITDLNKPELKMTEVELKKGEVNVVYSENTDIKKMLKHYQWREAVIKKERKFLKEIGIIPKHKCYKRDCEVCAQYDPIFV